jgi:hypothetical protein
MTCSFLFPLFFTTPKTKKGHGLYSPMAFRYDFYEDHSASEKHKATGIAQKAKGEAAKSVTADDAFFYSRAELHS